MITDEKYARLTTYTRSGEAKTLPIWLADLGDGDVRDLESCRVSEIRRQLQLLLRHLPDPHPLP